MTDLIRHPDPSTIEIKDRRQKPTSITGDQFEATSQFWQSTDEAAYIGVWECTPGRFTTVRDTSAETCFILSGRVSLHTEGGGTHMFQAGDMFTLPVGWRGIWEVHETVRKIYFIAQVA